MKLTFVGAAHEVTGSCHFLQVAGKNVLVDCGMEQGPDLYENPGLPISATEVDYVFLTHAHIDHSGMLPKLAKDGFKGQIFTTYATADLCDIMLRDSAHIQEFEADGGIEKAGEQESRSMNRFMRCRMHLMRLNCLCLSVWGAHYNL